MPMNHVYQGSRNEMHVHLDFLHNNLRVSGIEIVIPSTYNFYNVFYINSLYFTAFPILYQTFHKFKI